MRIKLDEMLPAALVDTLSGDGPFTARASVHLKRLTGSAAVLLTHSCTGA